MKLSQLSLQPVKLSIVAPALQLSNPRWESNCEDCTWQLCEAAWGWNLHLQQQLSLQPLLGGCPGFASTDTSLFWRQEKRDNHLGKLVQLPYVVEVELEEEQVAFHIGSNHPGLTQGWHSCPTGCHLVKGTCGTSRLCKHSPYRSLRHLSIISVWQINVSKNWEQGSIMPSCLFTLLLVLRPIKATTR